MDSNTSPDSTPDLPTPDPAAVWQEILASLEDDWPGIAAFAATQVSPEPEAEL